MLNSKGKLVFGLGLVVVLIIAGAIFLLSKPDAIDFLPSNGQNSADKPTELSSGTLSALEQPFSSYGLDINNSYSGIYWSPDNHYILFEGQPKMVAGQMETAPKVILGDLKEGTYKNIYDGSLVGAPSWSSSSVAFASDGIYLYDLARGEIKVVSSAPGHRPLLSPDGTKVVYEDNGLILYSVTTGASTVLLASKENVPAVWYKDGTRLLYWKSDGINLGDGAGMRQSVAVMDLVTKESKEFSSIPKGKFRTAEWIDEDHVYIFGGFDDGRSDYILNIKNETAHAFLQNMALGEYFFETDNDRAYVYHLGEFTTYDFAGKELSKVTLEGSSNPSLGGPYNMRIEKDNVVLTYVPPNSQQANLGVWDSVTGKKIKDLPVVEGTALFWSKGEYYIVLKGDGSALAIRKLEL